MEYRKDKMRNEVKYVYGVYELGDRNKSIVYIGEGKIRERLLAHFPDGSDPAFRLAFPS